MTDPRQPAAPGPADTPDPSAADRRREATLAGHRGDRGTARGLLADPSPVVRAAALGALARLEALEDGDLAAALADPDPGLRHRAVVLAAARPGPPLLALLGDAAATVVEVTAWALGERPEAEPGTVDALARLVVDHDDPLVREAAVAALGAIGDDRGLPAILHGLGDRATVRRRAVLALAPFEGPEVDAALERARTDRDWQVRQAAEELSDPS